MQILITRKGVVASAGETTKMTRYGITDRALGFESFCYSDWDSERNLRDMAIDFLVRGPRSSVSLVYTALISFGVAALVHVG